MAKRTDEKGRILRTGEQQRSSDGRYLYRYSDILGNRKTVYALTLQELREKEIEIQRDLDDHLDIAGSEMSLNELFQLYMDTKANIKQSSRACYLIVWKDYVQNTDIGMMKIKDIKSAHIRKLYAGYMEKGYCEGTIREIHKLINSSFNLAVDSDMIRKNPAKNCGRDISGGKHKREAMTRAEQAELMEFVSSDKTYKHYSPIITFLLNTGLRAGELAGLTWEDVDLKNNVIHVRQQLVYLDYGEGYRYYVQSLKTENSERDIPLTQDAKKALLEQKEHDLKDGVQRKEVDGVNDLVFVNSKGMPYGSIIIDAALDRIVKKYNKDSDSMQLPRISAHILRHTFASRCAEAGMDAKTLQIILGHSDISTTMNVYVQMDNTQIAKNFHEAELRMKVS